MNRFIADLSEAVLAAPARLQTVEPALVSCLARRRRARGCSSTETEFWRGGRAASPTRMPMKTLVLALSLGALLYAANFVQPAKAQTLDAAREQALRECSRMQFADPHEPQEGKKTGGRMFVHKTCMADHGQFE